MFEHPYIAFLIFSIPVAANWAIGLYFSKKPGKARAENASRIFGTITMAAGLVVLMLAGLSNNVFRYLAMPDQKALWITAGLALITFLAIRQMLIKSKSSQAPAQALPEANERPLLFPALVWVLYLFMYEWFFRGLLWLWLLEKEFPFMPLLVLNVIFYTAVHSFKDRKEIIACLPYGVCMCVATYYAQSFWPAFISHITVALLVHFSHQTNTQTKAPSFARTQDLNEFD